MGIVILLIAVAIVIVAVAVVAVYYFSYTRIINTRLQGQISNGKKLWSPAKVAIVTAFIGLILFSSIVLLIRMNNTEANSIDDQYLNSIYSYEVYSPEDMGRGYLGSFSVSENIGYTKTEETIGDIKYTNFISNDKFDIYHPAFIIFAEYVGESDVVSYGVQGTYLTTTHEPIFGTGSSGADVPDYICIIGNTSIDCIFQLSLYYYDKDGRIALNQSENVTNGNSPELASAYATMNIIIDRSQN